MVGVKMKMLTLFLVVAVPLLDYYYLFIENIS